MENKNFKAGLKVMCNTIDYRNIGGPATMCDYYMETRGRIIPKKSGLPKCQHDEEADEKPCREFFCGMCRYMPIKKKD